MHVVTNKKIVQTGMISDFVWRNCVMSRVSVEQAVD